MYFYVCWTVQIPDARAVVFPSVIRRFSVPPGDEIFEVGALKRFVADYRLFDIVKEPQSVVAAGTASITSRHVLGNI